MSILFPEFLPLLLIPMAYHVHRAIKYVKPETGSYWSKSTSIFFLKTGMVNKITIMVCVIRGINADLVPMNISLVTYYCKEVGISPAVV